MLTVVPTSSNAAPQCQTKPQDFQRMVEMINKFTLNTVDLTNRFAHDCDVKLGNIARTLYRLECHVTLLEFKLDSIENEKGEKVDRPVRKKKEEAVAPVTRGVIGAPPGMGGAGAGNQPPPMGAGHGRNAPPPAPGAGVNQPPLPPGVAPPMPGMIMPPPGPPGAPPRPDKPAMPPPMPTTSGFTVRTHPRLQGYFQMAAANIPAVAIKAKMAADGYKPEWFDTPDMASPLPASAAKKITEFDSD